MALDHRVLIGRTDELAQLGDAARRSPGPNVVVVSGEAGIGKSRLLEHVIDERRADGWQVLAGGCVEVSGEPIPYAPVAAALRAARRELAGTGAAADVVAGIDIMLGGGPDRPRDLAELFEHALSIVQRIADAGPLVLALEDLHWADAGTLDMISFLLRNLTGDALLLLTYRHEDWHRTPALRRLIEALVRSRQVTHIRLDRLDRDELAELGAAVGAEISGPELDRLYERSQGNPFIAEELLVAGSDVDVPTALHDILLARAAEIEPDAEHLVRVAATLGRPVAHDLLAACSRLDDERFARAVRESVETGLLVVDTEREEYAFRHVLTQDAVRQRLLPAEARRLHAAIAAALGLDPDVQRSASRATEWAAHVLASGDRTAALQALLQAGRLAAGVYSYGTAWRQYQRVVELLDALDDRAGVEPRTVFAEAAEAARWSGEPIVAVELAHRADLASSDVHDRAALAERTGRYLVDAGRFTDAEASFARAAELATGVDDPELHARVAVSSARLLMLTGRFHEAIDRARAALELAVTAASPGEQGRAHTALGMSQVLVGEVAEGLQHVRDGHALVHRHGDLDDRRRADSNLSYALLVAGRTSEACEVGVAGLQLMRRYGLAAAGGGSLTSNAIVLLRISGRWPEAEQLSDEAEADGLPEGMALRIALSRTELEIARGQLDRAREQLAKAHELAGEQSSSEVVADLHLAEALIALGHEDLPAAVTSVDRAVALADTENPRLTARACLLALRIEGELTDRVHRARTDDAAIERITRLHALLTETVQSTPSPELRAYAATAAGEFSRAARTPEPGRWADAADQWSALERPRGIAYCLFRQAEAELLLRRQAAARTLLARAHQLALELGAEPILDAIGSLAERARIRMTDVVVRTRTSDANQPQLTPRELQVLVQLRAGHTNREIAAALYLSPRTVGVHVSNVLAKLQVKSRTEAVAAAAALHLLDPEGKSS